MRKQQVGVGLLALAGGSMAMYLGWLLIFRPLLGWDRPAAQPWRENVEQRRQEVADAFRNQAAPLGGDVAESVRPLFDNLGRALEAGNAAQIAT